MATLAYSEYVSRDFTRAAARAQLAASPGVQSYFGLSPFDVPQSVSVTVLGDDVAIFHFDYANAEPADRVLRSGSRDGRVDVVLGKESRKVLQVYVHEPRALLIDRSPSIDLGIVAEWAIKLPSHAAKASSRSAALVNMILESMPSPFRKAVIRAIDIEVARNQARATQS